MLKIVTGEFKMYDFEEEALTPTKLFANNEHFMFYYMERNWKLWPS